eukprot:3438637-Lingulodinium_polyedra.AAC.1
MWQKRCRRASAAVGFKERPRSSDDGEAGTAGNAARGSNKQTQMTGRSRQRAGRRRQTTGSSSQQR